MGRNSKILRSIPRTIWFNFRYLPFRQAIRLPIWIANNVRIKELHRGCLDFEGSLRIGLIRIGYHEADGIDIYHTHTILNISKLGHILFREDAHIGQGAIIKINDNGIIIFGRNFAISGTTSIIASKSIFFGDDVQLSWNSLIMDGDAHKIFDEDGNWINPPREIKIGNKVWIAANTTILNGSVIADNTIVASNSLVGKVFYEGDCIVGGSPSKILKKISHFTI